MRQTHQCPKCQATEIYYLPGIADSHQAAIAIHAEQGWLGPTLYGRLEAYVCAACGLTELYAVEPASIPIDQIPGAKRLSPAPRPPYR